MLAALAGGGARLDEPYTLLVRLFAALHQAAFEGNAELVEELLARGADLSLRDAVYDGTPAGWAEAGGNEDLAKRLAARSG